MEISIEQKLRNLHNLQAIHTKIDKIHTVRGELPLEVQDLEDDVTGLLTRITKINDDIKDFDKQIAEKNTLIKESKALIEKYEQQQSNVKNNREFEALNKEIEIQGLEIQVAEKRIREYTIEINQLKSHIDGAQNRYDERVGDLNVKKAELDGIIAETEKEEAKFIKEAEKAEAQIESRLNVAYYRLRNNSKNGLAVVTIDRDSCSGCFANIPPQRQSDIRQRKKIIVCEHCGRIVVDEIIAGTMEEVIAE